MTWTRLSDDFSDDCDQLSSDAFRLHVEGLIRSNRKLLDLKLDKNQMRRWVWNPGLADIAVKDLLSAGWWSDEGDHYLIRHHACYQRTREQVLKQQEVNQNNGKKGGRPRGSAREQSTNLTPETHSVSESVSESKTERDGSGLDWTEKTLLREVVEVSENRNSSGPDCRYCHTELRPSQVSQHQRGYCNRPACMEASSAERTG